MLYGVMSGDVEAHLVEKMSWLRRLLLMAEGESSINHEMHVLQGLKQLSYSLVINLLCGFQQTLFESHPLAFYSIVPILMVASQLSAIGYILE
ncbi:MAG: hypothetical protein GY816_10485 [Cytophagales bacterium]|nr:hypothetical protein [Cytophagales bacterium]